MLKFLVTLFGFVCLVQGQLFTWQHYGNGPNDPATGQPRYVMYSVTDANYANYHVTVWAGGDIHASWNRNAPGYYAPQNRRWHHHGRNRGNWQVSDADLRVLYNSFVVRRFWNVPLRNTFDVFWGAIDTVLWAVGLAREEYDNEYLLYDYDDMDGNKKKVVVKEKEEGVDAYKDYPPASEGLKKPLSNRPLTKATIENIIKSLGSKPKGITQDDDKIRLEALKDIKAAYENHATLTKELKQEKAKKKKENNKGKGNKAVREYYDDIYYNDDQYESRSQSVSSYDLQSHPYALQDDGYMLLIVVIVIATLCIGFVCFIGCIGCIASCFGGYYYREKQIQYIKTRKNEDYRSEC